MNNSTVDDYRKTALVLLLVQTLSNLGELRNPIKGKIYGMWSREFVYTMPQGLPVEWMDGSRLTPPNT